MLRILKSGILGMFLAATHATPVVAQSETFQLSPHLSYYNHSWPDRDALMSRLGVSAEDLAYVGGERPVSALDGMYVQITGTMAHDRYIAGIQRGDYIHIRVSGRIRTGSSEATPRNFSAAAVLVAGRKIREWHGWGNRFTQSGLNNPSNPLKVASIPTNPKAANGFTLSHTGKTGNSGGFLGEQDMFDDFSIGSNTNNGVIVRVPDQTGRIFLFTSVDETNFSSLYRDRTRLHIRKVDANTGRPTLSLATTSVNEGHNGGLIISRTNAVDFRTKVQYRIIVDGSTSADAEDFLSTRFDGYNAWHTVDIPRGESSVETPPFFIVQDGVWEGPESFKVQLRVLPNDNPNEAYIPGADSNGRREYSVTINDGDPLPVLDFSSRTSSVNEPAGTHNIGVRLSLPSKHNINVYFAHRNHEVATHGGGGTVAAVGTDFNYTQSPNNSIPIPAGQMTANIPVNIPSNPKHTGPQKVVFHLGVDSNRADYNRDGANGRHVLTINDAQAPPAVSLGEFDELQIDEGGPGESKVVNLVVSQNRASIFDTLVKLQWSGMAAWSGKPEVPDSQWDFNAPATVRIPAGQMTANLDVTIRGDAIREFDETVVVRIDDVMNGTIGFTGTRSFTIMNDDGVTSSEIVAPPARAAVAPGSVTVGVGNDFPVAVWRVAGEPHWRMEGDAAEGLAPGWHEIEFRALQGYATPSRQRVLVSSGALASPVVSYEELQPPASGSLVVTLSPSSAKWRLEGAAEWLDSGATVANLPAGTHRIVFGKVADRGIPRPATVMIPAGGTASRTIFYPAAPLAGVSRPVVLGNAQTQELPMAFCGRVSSSAGFGTGTAVRERVVLTVAHALFDEQTFTYARNVRWHHQVQQGHHHPGEDSEEALIGTARVDGPRIHDSHIVPRGWVLMGGYAAQRVADLQDPGRGAGQGLGTPESQQLDVGAMFFAQHVAGTNTDGIEPRGARAGMLVAETPGQWLSANVDKRLVGYPVEGIEWDERGKMHASNAANINFFLQHASVYRSSMLAASPGVSGGPVFLRDGEKWLQAAIYLGGTANEGVFREIDLEVEKLVDVAGMLSNVDDNGTGGMEYYESTSVGDDSFEFSENIAFGMRPGQVAFSMNAPGARWRPLGFNQPSFASGVVADTFLAGEFVAVEFLPVEGWLAPPMQFVEAVEGEAPLEARYLPLSYAAMRAGMEHADPSRTAPNGDFDGDGIPNLLEWAFNLDPKSPGRRTLGEGSDHSGLPSVRVAGEGAARRLVVEFIRIRPETGAKLAYEVQFSSDPSSGTWQSGGRQLGRVAVDAHWERVIIEDTAPPTQARFARVKVTETP